jgi:hypothetical protein
MNRATHAFAFAAVAIASAFAVATGCGMSNSRQASAPPPAAPPIVIDVLTDEDARDLDGCACAFYAPGDDAGTQPIIGWVDPNIADAHVRIEGVSQVLGPVEQRDGARPHADGRPEKGDLTTFLMRNDRTRATLECRISETCWEDESCESIGYRCDLEVESGGRRGERKVEGYCGC